MSTVSLAEGVRPLQIWRAGYDSKLHPIVRLELRRSDECREPVYFHDRRVISVWVTPIGQSAKKKKKKKKKTLQKQPYKSVNMNVTSRYKIILNGYTCQ